jgi:hypothetical protein
LRTGRRMRQGRGRRRRRHAGQGCLPARIRSSSHASPPRARRCRTGDRVAWLATRPCAVAAASGLAGALLVRRIGSVA